jgi:hypothetical protein
MSVMDRYFEGLPFEKVTIEGIECYKSDDGRFFRIDEGKTFVALECAGDEHGVEINDFEDVDLFDKETEDSDMTGAIRSLLEELIA